MKKWHECACGESICAPDSEFGQVILAEWMKVHKTHIGMRRRCGWCGVRLRWWQVNLCRVCRIYAQLGFTHPCREGSRWDAPADRRPG